MVNGWSCPVCGYKLKTEIRDNSPDDTYYDCPNCGKFYLSSRALRILPEDQKSKAIISHNISKRKDRSKPFSMKDIRFFLEQSLPSPVEQIENLVLCIGDTLDSLGDMIEVHPKTYQAKIGSFNELGVVLALKFLRENGTIEGGYDVVFAAGRQEYAFNILGDVSLTMHGWDYYRQLKQGVSETDIAFMAMKFGDEALDNAYSIHFKKAVDETGFELRRLDEKPEPGLIDNRLKAEILKSKFLIADLTQGNNGAYWEAGFAEGLGKPVIYTCERAYFEKHKTHFDTNHYFTVLWDEGNIEEDMQVLKSSIEIAFQ